jgi:hypothetical protein
VKNGREGGDSYVAEACLVTHLGGIYGDAEGLVGKVGECFVRVRSRTEERF